VTKNICFEFIGGPLDGKRVSDTSPDPRDAKLARFLNVATKGGCEGRWFRGLSTRLLSDAEQARFHLHEVPDLVFEVIRRQTKSNETVVHIRQQMRQNAR
jgi:hypothetical protein